MIEKLTSESRFTKREKGICLMKDQSFYGPDIETNVTRLASIIARYEDLEEDLSGNFGMTMNLISKALDKGIVDKKGYERNVGLYKSSNDYYLKSIEPVFSLANWDADYIEYEVHKYRIKDYKKTWWIKGERTN